MELFDQEIDRTVQSSRIQVIIMIQILDGYIDESSQFTGQCIFKYRGRQNIRLAEIVE